MKELTHDHPLIGTWVTKDEDSDAVFTISVSGGEFSVTGYCHSDGELFEIGDIVWDGKWLSFLATMPSTNTRTRNSFHALGDGTAVLRYTIEEIWIKKAGGQPGS